MLHGTKRRAHPKIRKGTGILVAPVMSASD